MASFVLVLFLIGMAIPFVFSLVPHNWKVVDLSKIGIVAGLCCVAVAVMGAIFGNEIGKAESRAERPEDQMICSHINGLLYPLDGEYVWVRGSEGNRHMETFGSCVPGNQKEFAQYQLWMAKRTTMALWRLRAELRDLDAPEEIFNEADRLWLQSETQQDRIEEQIKSL